MMDVMILDSIPCKIELHQLLNHLHIKEDSTHVKQVREFVGAALQIGRPKAVYLESYVDSKSDEYVVIDGVKFNSRVLRVNLAEVYRVFPYVVTCGSELEEWSYSNDDLFFSFCANGIQDIVLGNAAMHLFAQIDEKFGLAHASYMNPGSLEDWPLKDQIPLFSLLGDLKQSIGVTLTDSFIMQPKKSVSGIRFPSEGTFENCLLCPREKCPGRRAPYDKNLFDKKYKFK